MHRWLQKLWKPNKNIRPTWQTCPDGDWIHCNWKKNKIQTGACLCLLPKKRGGSLLWCCGFPNRWQVPGNHASSAGCTLKIVQEIHCHLEPASLSSAILGCFNYPLILRILGFQIAPHLVGKYIIPGLRSLPQYPRLFLTEKHTLEIAHTQEHMSWMKCSNILLQTSSILDLGICGEMFTSCMVINRPYVLWMKGSCAKILSIISCIPSSCQR